MNIARILLTPTPVRCHNKDTITLFMMDLGKLYNNTIHLEIIIDLIANQATFSILETRQSSYSDKPESQITTQINTLTPESTPTNSNITKIK